jgi:hypothetical protein
MWMKGFFKRRNKQVYLERRAEERLQKRTDGIILDEHLENHLKKIEKVLGHSSDLVIRRCEVADRKAAVLFISGLVDEYKLDQFVMRPLLTCRISGESLEKQADDVFEACHIQETREFREWLDGLLSGKCLVLFDGFSVAILAGVEGWPKRSVEQPSGESVVRGPREGFIETVKVNTALIRKRLKDPDLRVKEMKVGERTKTAVHLLYIEGITNEKIVEEVQRRISRIRIDGVLEGGYVEELIQDYVWSPFPQLQNTERPDSAVGHLLEGKVVILVDGTPHALIAPAIFSQFYTSPEDYYERFMIASFLRFLRLLSLVIALLLPSVYIALISIHPEMLPTILLNAVASDRQLVPLTSIQEALGMELSVEILREAAIRLPRPIGSTIGIVGALVIGETAVIAGLISPLMVVVVGLTTVSSYANPNYNAAISLRLLRFLLMISASILGLYGVMLVLLLILIHLVKLRSFGVPYLAPFSPLRWSDLKDVFIRLPWTMMRKRPHLFRPDDPSRQ